MMPKKPTSTKQKKEVMIITSQVFLPLHIWQLPSITTLREHHNKHNCHLWKPHDLTWPWRVERWSSFQMEQNLPRKDKTWSWQSNQPNSIISNHLGMNPFGEQPISGTGQSRWQMHWQVVNQQQVLGERIKQMTLNKQIQLRRESSYDKCQTQSNSQGYSRWMIPTQPLRTYYLEKARTWFVLGVAKGRVPSWALSAILIVLDRSTQLPPENWELEIRSWVKSRDINCSCLPSWTICLTLYGWIVNFPSGIPSTTWVKSKAESPGEFTDSPSG